MAAGGSLAAALGIWIEWLKMKSEEGERRRAILRGLKEKEHADFLAALPAPKSDIRDLFDYLDSDEPCDNTLRRAVVFINERSLPEERVKSWLEEHGGYCDCEVIFNVEDVWNQMVEEEWRRN